MDERYDLNYYSNRFMDLKSNLDTQIYSYRDCKDGVEKLEDTSYKLIIKRILILIFYLLSNNGDIQIGFKRDYINELHSKYSNGLSFKVFHAGDKLSVNSTRMQSMDIFNHISNDISKFLINYLNQTNFHRDLLHFIIHYL